MRTAAVDCSNTTLETYSSLAKDHGDLDVGIIVNNVGLSYEHPEYLDACSSDVSTRQFLKFAVPKIRSADVCHTQLGNARRVLI